MKHKLFKSIAAWIAGLVAMMALQAPAEGQSHPRLSPDGTRIAHFRFDLDAGTADILLTDRVSGETTPLVTGHAWSVNPGWAPDGQSLVFIGAEAGVADTWDVYELDLTDMAVTALTQTGAREMHSQMAPDGPWLSFVRMTDGPDVWVLNRQTGEARRLAATSDRDFHPKWSPDGQRLVFDRTTGAGETLIMDVTIDGDRQAVVARASGETRLRLPDIADNGDIFAVASTGEDYSLVRFSTGQPAEPILRALAGEQFGAFDLAGDGDSVALSITGADGRIRLYLVDMASGSRDLVYE
ncbi:hypothetical protein [Maricaulis sp.]|uniref:TolB family protein n=1 Tax=Maricaulis sp. TaxID=1486257 RepID=UPI0025BBC981|nr:hypothetical protein [Maricaulis sp.]